MNLFFGIFDAPGGHLIADYSSRVRGLRFGTGEHGYADLSGFVPMTLAESFRLYDRPALPHVLVMGAGARMWEGRLEDVAIVNGGVRLGAFGYGRALGDAPYMALWSTTSVAEWFPLDNRMMGDNTPDRFNFDTNNRLYITPQKNATLGNTGQNKIGRLGYVLGHRSDRNLVAISFDYDFLAPTGWQCGLQSWTAPYPVDSSLWTFSTTIWLLSGNGTNQTGSINQTFTGINALAFFLYRPSPDAVYGSETGTDYLKITNLRIKTTTSSSVYADEIAKALVAFMNGINSAQLQNIAALIESPALDLRDEIYEDVLPSDILTKLALLGDNQVPPRQWEWGVWEDRILHFRPRDSQARAWYVDVSALEVERTIETLRNSAYAKYQDTDNRTLRTAVSADADSVARYGLTRRGYIDVSTTSATQANTHRDAFLQDRKDPIPRSAIAFDAIFDASGARWPLFAPRSGDTITIRNLPPTLGAGIDRIRTFRLAHTEYDVDGDVLHVEPESPLPRLDVLVARREERIRTMEWFDRPRWPR